MKLPAGHVAGQGVVKPTGYGGLGERLLRGMGWEKGQGLGKEGHGLKQAIEVKKKENTAGIGGTQAYNWENKWWESAFDSAVQAVGGDSSDSSDSSSDEEGGGAPAAAVRNHDGTLTSASLDELKLQSSLSKGGKLAAGRFGGRDGKMARIRAQEAAAAAAAEAKLAGAADRADTPSEAHTARGGNAPASSAGGADAPPPPKRARIVIEPVVVREAPAYDFRPTEMAGWWGAATFQPAGCLGGIEKDVQRAAKERAAFDEDEQARIYTAAQAGKTQGKTGLGQSTGTLKVGGVKWEGNKTTFGEDGGLGEPAAKKVATPEQGGAAAKKTKKKAKLAAAGAAAAAAAAEAAAGEEPSWAGGIKWKKLLSRALLAAPAGQLKLKALHAEVLRAVAVRVEGASGREVRALVATRLQASSRFVVEGKLVTLKPAA